MKATATYSVKKWEENAVKQLSPDMKLTKASVEFEFTGDLEGKALVEYLMFYSHADEKNQHNSAASYVGLIGFEGTLAGRSGSFVMRDDGNFISGVANSTLTILEGSGIGGLKGIAGTGSYQADKNGCRFEMEYDL